MRYRSIHYQQSEVGTLSESTARGIGQTRCNDSRHPVPRPICRVRGWPRYGTHLGTKDSRILNPDVASASEVQLPGGGVGESVNHSSEVSPTRCRVAPTRGSSGLGGVWGPPRTPDTHTHTRAQGRELDPSLCLLCLFLCTCLGTSSLSLCAVSVQKLQPDEG
jgi:hypothetical protein